MNVYVSRIFGVVNGQSSPLPAEDEGEPTDTASKALENPGKVRGDGFEKDKKHFIYDSKTNQIGDSA